MSRFIRQNLMSSTERAEVYAALDSQTMRRCVIKKHLAQGDAQVARDNYMAQYDRLIAIESSHIVKILGRVGKLSTILEPMVGDLTSCSQRFNRNFSLARGLLVEILSGLGELHAKGIVHGDLQFSHILRDQAGHFKLLITPTSDQATRPVKEGPDARHVAPELLWPDKYGPCGPWVDIYALGVMVYQLLVGPEFDQLVSHSAQDEAQVHEAWRVRHASEQRLPLVEELLPEAPRDMAELINRMIAKDQALRFRNASECLAFLENPEANLKRSQAEHKADSDHPAAIEVGKVLVEDIYQGPLRVTWADIFRDPTLLLIAEARNHRRQLGMVCLLTAAMFCLLVLRQSSSSVADAGTINPEDIRIDLPVPAVPVAEDILGDVATLTTPGSTEQPTEEPQKNGDERENVAPELPIEPAQPMVVLPQQTLEQPQKFVLNTTSDPYYEVRGKHFYPETVGMPWRVEVVAHEERQRYATREALQSIIQQRLPRGKAPFAIPNSPVDPRASMALAIIAYQGGDLKVAKDLCRRSLRDAQHFDVPFVMPVRLLNHIQIDKAEFSAALAECRQVADWIGAKGRDPQHQRQYHAAADEMAWWTGIMVGYFEDVRKTTLPSNVDVKPTLALVQRWNATTYWQPYLIARRDVVERKQQVTLLWGDRKAAEDVRRAEEIREEDLAELKFEQRRREAFERMIQYQSMQYGSGQLGAGQFGSRQYGMGQYNTGGVTENRNARAPYEYSYERYEPNRARVPTRMPPAVLHPDEFANYHACAPAALAQQTLFTISTVADQESFRDSSQLSTVVKQ